MNVKHLDRLESVSQKLAQIHTLQTSMSISCKSIPNPEQGLDLISDCILDAKQEIDTIVKENQQSITN